MPAAPAAVPTIDATPGLGDLTSFDQAKAAPVPHPSLASKEPAPSPSPAPAKGEVQLDKPADMEAMNKLPNHVEDDLANIAKGMTAKEAAAKSQNPDTKTEPEEPTNGEPDELEKQVQAYKTLKEVRTAHKEALKRERAWKAQENEWKAKIEQAESRLKDYNPEASKAVSEQLQAIQKERDELLEKVKVMDYQQHPEFHTKYTQPLAKAMERAYTDIKAMEIEGEDGTRRKATESDFHALLTMAPHKAGESAEKLFGRWGAQQIVNHVQRIQELRASQQEALTNASKLAEESRQRQTVEEAQRVEKLQSVFKQRGVELETKYPDLFKAKDEDADGKAMLEKGWKLVNSLESQDISDEDRVKLAAETRYRAAAFGKLFLDNKRLQESVQELTKKLKGYENSSPKEGDGGNSPKQEPSDPWHKAMSGLDAIARPMR